MKIRRESAIRRFLTEAFGNERGRAVIPRIALYKALSQDGFSQEEAHGLGNCSAGPPPAWKFRPSGGGGISPAGERTSSVAGFSRAAALVGNLFSPILEKTLEISRFFRYDSYGFFC